MKLDLDRANVHEYELTVTEIRADTEELHDKVYGWLDVAQGDVFGNDKSEAYIVIKITK